MEAADLLGQVWSATFLEISAPLQGPEPGGELTQLFLLAAGQPVAAGAIIQMGLAQPVPQRLLRDPEVLGDLTDQLAAGPDQPVPPTNPKSTGRTTDAPSVIEEPLSARLGAGVGGRPLISRINSSPATASSGQA
jgi:hypothetical protein